MGTTKITDLTVEELLVLIRTAVREVLAEEQTRYTAQHSQFGLLDIPPLSVGSWPEGLKLLSREEYYNDDGR